MKKLSCIALSLAASLLLSTAAFAADTNENFVYASVDGKENVAVTSADSDYSFELTDIFDHDSSTTAKFEFAEDEDKTVNIYTALANRTVADTFAVMIGGESGTVITINVYGSNDSTLKDWYQIPVLNPAEDKDGYKIFSLKEFARKYTYYRFEFTLQSGEYFTLSELSLLRDETDEVPLRYVSDGEVEPGTAPKLVPIPTETEKLSPFTGCPFLRFFH